MELICGKLTYSLGNAPEVTIEHYRRNTTNFGTYSEWELDPHQITPIYPQTIYGTFPEQFRNHSEKSTKMTIRIHYGIHTDIPNIVRKLPGRRHVSYSFYPYKRRLFQFNSNYY